MELNEIRALYESSSTNKSKKKILEDYLNREADMDDALLLAYKAALNGIKANEALFPFSKLRYLNDSLAEFKKAVSLNPENIEIRFLRFTIEHHIPSMLNMGNNLQKDKLKIIEGFESSEITAELKEKIATYLINSGRCNTKEIEKIKGKSN